MKRWLYLFSVSLMCLWACKQEVKVITYYESGSIREEYNITSDSLRNGIYVKLYENGDTLEKSNYINDRLNGVRVLYHSGNRPEIREHYVEDTLEGLYQVFYEDGQLKISMNYTKNVLNDVVTKYYPSGAIMEKVSFQNNQEEGPFTEFYENGQKKWEGTYTNGDNEIGLLIHFSETGDTIRKMMCDDRFICRTIYENDQYIDSE